MEKLIIDTRATKEFQKNHPSGALNMTLKNLGKYGRDLLTADQDITVIAETAGEFEEVKEILEPLNLRFDAKMTSEADLDQNNWIASNLIDPEAFMALEDDYVLLDVRHPDEITRIAPEKNLVNIPLEMLGQVHDKLDKNTPIYTLCGSGGRATTAASYLERLGYNTTVIDGGMKALEPLVLKDKE